MKKIEALLLNATCIDCISIAFIFISSAIKLAMLILIVGIVVQLVNL